MFLIKFTDNSGTKEVADDNAQAIESTFCGDAVAFSDGGWECNLDDAAMLIDAMDPHGRVLVWSNFEDSDNDDGSKAIAVITHKKD